MSCFNEISLFTGEIITTCESQSIQFFHMESSSLISQLPLLHPSPFNVICLMYNIFVRCDVFRVYMRTSFGWRLLHQRWTQIVVSVARDTYRQLDSRQTDRQKHTCIHIHYTYTHSLACTQQANMDFLFKSIKSTIITATTPTMGKNVNRKCDMCVARRIWALWRKRKRKWFRLWLDMLSVNTFLIVLWFRYVVQWIEMW